MDPKIMADYMAFLQTKKGLDVVGAMDYVFEAGKTQDCQSFLREKLSGLAVDDPALSKKVLLLMAQYLAEDARKMGFLRYSELYEGLTHLLLEINYQPETIQ